MLSFLKIYPIILSYYGGNVKNKKVYFYDKFSKKSKKKFSIKKTFEESWLICMIIALSIVMVNHIIKI